MGHPQLGRADVPLRAVCDFLERAGKEPAGLLIEGEAGIGKTTVWADARLRGAEAGFRVLTARASDSEARLTFSVLADLLEDVDPSVLACLPSVQRVALDRVLLRGGDGPVTDERVAAAAFRSVVELLADESPVLIAIDDVHWLDRASRTVVGYAARRFDGPVGLLATVRSEDPGWPATSWLRLAHPDGLHRLSLDPLSLGSLHSVIADRLGKTLTRPLITRIHAISGGNPFYALELARTIDATGVQVGFPSSLKALVAERLGVVGEQAGPLLLAAACAANPTVAELAEVTHLSVDQAVELLESVEDQGIIALDGNRVRFAHPLLSYGVYSRASAAQRRAMHREFAARTEVAELRARHLALAAVTADEPTLQALDTAAGAAAARGAPSAAAELLELALGLGGDDPWRRLRAAEQHFRAASFDHADNHLQSLIETQPPGMLRAIALMLRGAVYSYGDRFGEAVDVLTQGIAEAGEAPALRVQGLLLLALAVGLADDMSASIDYARRAVADAEQAGDPVVRSHALALWVQVSFMYGLGTDEQALQTALELEDIESTAPVTLRPTAVAAVNRAWTGQLDEARTGLVTVQQRCQDRGNEVDVVWAAKVAADVERWLANYGEAARLADAAVEHAEQIGGQLPLIDALTAQAAVAAYQGHEDHARRAAHAAIEAARKNNFGYLVRPPTATLVFLEVSLRDYDAALTELQPLLDAFDPVHGTEIVVGSFLPDAIETLTAVGRVDDAESLVAALETNGARLDRPWMLATGARGRAAVLAARGDLDAAAVAAQQAMVHHERLPMPFERARTQLLLGLVERRRRRRQAAAPIIAEALNSFQAIGAGLWAARAQSDVDRCNTHTGDGVGLTTSELRVAERAAAGLSNRDIAAELFMSPKTVEMNLSRVYRKLGIRSRSQLHTRLGDRNRTSAP